MSHKVTSENGSVDEKQIGQLRNNNQNFSCPLHFLWGEGGRGRWWALIQGLAVINFSSIQDGYLFKVGV